MTTVKLSDNDIATTIAILEVWVKEAIRNKIPKKDCMFVDVKRALNKFKATWGI